MQAVARRAAAKAVQVVADKSAGVQLIYASHSAWPYVDKHSQEALDIAVLDSSFNPPSKAHLALLNSKPLLAPNKVRYDGHLLLFSTQNADKGAGKPGDASLEQRATMMTLMAQHMEHTYFTQGHTANIAVGLVDKPLIFAKSTLTCELLRHQQAQFAPDRQDTAARLHWVVGFDTLYRVFQLKYYPSPDVFHTQCKQFFEQERTTFVCARRHPSSFPSLAGTEKPTEAVARQEEDKLLQSDNVEPWVKAGRITMLDIDPEEAALSSTHIRTHLADTTTTDAHKKQAITPLVPPSLINYLVDTKVYHAH